MLCSYLVSSFFLTIYIVNTVASIVPLGGSCFEENKLKIEKL